MSIESAIDRLATAIEAHAKVMAALGGPIPTDAGKTDSGKTDGAKPDPKEDGTRTIYWANEDGTYGKCSAAEYKKMSKGDDTYSLIDPDEFKARGEASKKKQNDNKAAADKAQKVKDAAAAKKAAEDKDAEGDISDEDLGAVIKPFAGVDTPKERTRRVNWLKAVFARFNVAKASELPQDQRAEFLDLVNQAVAAVEDDEGADLPDAEGGGSDDGLV
jgi:hypothetical protein